MTHETLNESAQAGHEINNLVQTFDHCTDGYPASVVLKPAPAPQYESTSKKVNGQPVWTGKLSRSRERVLLEPLKTKSRRSISSTRWAICSTRACPTSGSTRSSPSWR